MIIAPRLRITISPKKRRLDGDKQRAARYLFNCMTTQQKTAAIQQIVANHQENVAATNAAQVPAGLDGLVIQARNAAFIDDLKQVFAMPAAGAAVTFDAADAGTSGASPASRRKSRS